MALASALVSVMIDAVRKTARPMLRDFGEVAQLQVSRKGPGDFVTAADIKAEDTLYELLMKARPGYGFLGRGARHDGGDRQVHMWIVDPIDGNSPTSCTPCRTSPSRSGWSARHPTARPRSWPA
jgi:myo-inositol-1(or 4)-monophosphatase